MSPGARISRKRTRASPHGPVEVTPTITSPPVRRSRRLSNLLPLSSTNITTITPTTTSVPSIHDSARELPKLRPSQIRQSGSFYQLPRNRSNPDTCSPTAGTTDEATQPLHPSNLLAAFASPSQSLTDMRPDDLQSIDGSGLEDINHPAWGLECDPPQAIETSSHMRENLSEESSMEGSVHSDLCPSSSSPVATLDSSSTVPAPPMLDQVSAPSLKEIDHGETNPHILLEGPDKSLYADFTDDERECYCDCLLCSGCKSKTQSCEKHPGVFCDGPCGRYMHLQCCGLTHMEDHADPPARFAVNKLSPNNPIPMSTGETQHSNGPVPWYCIACTPDNVVTSLEQSSFATLKVMVDSGGRNHHPDRSNALLILSKRLGIPLVFLHPEDPHLHVRQDRTFRLMRKKVWDIHNQYKMLIPPVLFNSILDNHPSPYPTTKPMDQLIQQDMALHGRRFELSLLSYSIKECACCSRTQPFYIDPCSSMDSQYRSATGLRPKFTRMHLASKYFDAVQCTGLNCGCNGGQYFLSTYKKHMAYYLSTHDQTIDVALGNGSLLSVEICSKCRKEIQSDKEELFQLPRKFSIGNGFGAEPSLIDQPAIIKELHSLLDRCTPAEEAAIRKITPLVSIARLKHGNIASKGTISCVSQDSTLLSVLPRLPSECKTIVIMRQGNSNGKPTRLPSFSFRKVVIHRILHILHEIDHPAFEFTLSQENLDEWPDEGNLLDMASTVHIPDALEDTKGADGTIPASMQNCDVDGGDMGPAPLQNDSHDEVFEGTVPMAPDNNLKDDAAQAMAAFQETVASVRNNARAVAASTSAMMTPMTIPFQVIPLQLWKLLSRPQLIILPPPANYNVVGSQVQLEQESHLPTGDFVDMMRTPYAWTQAFHTIFWPFFDSTDECYKVYGDFTGLHHELRELSVTAREWSEYIMWTNNGRAARHPIFPLVLSNELFRRSVYSQAQVSLNLDGNFDPNESVEKLVCADLQDDSKVNDLATKVNHYVGNVPGTDQYFKSVKKKFTATHFHHGYTKNLPLSAFHTGSLAEFHDPFLRQLLASYASATRSAGFSQSVLDNDGVFHSFMNECKHIVTHYFVAKMEIWLDVFLSHVIGLVEFTGRNEFAKSRGAIHAHLLLYCSSIGFDDIGSLMDSLLQEIDQLMRELDATIRQMETTQGVNPKKSCTLDKSPKTGLESRRTFLCRSPAGRNLFNNYKEQVDTLKSSRLSKQVTDLMDRHFAVSASHVGRAPTDLPAPAGRKDLGYRSSSDGMQSKNDILQKKELGKFKFTEETRLYDRQCNIVNHCLNHRCSNYCWKEEVMVVKYNPLNHKQNNPCIIEWITNKDEVVSHVKLRYWKCRMGFGNKLIYPRGPAGTRDYTGGAPCLRISKVEFDKNGMPKYFAARNHPTIVQEPTSMLYWGANADLQVFLTNRSSFKTFRERHTNDRVIDGETHDDFSAQYEGYIQNLACNEVSGLDQFIGSEGVMCYTCGYSCKGHANSNEWNATFRACADAAEKDTPIRKVVSKFCTNISKKRNISRDEASFVLAGGAYTISSSFVRACSVSSINLSELDTDSEQTGGNSSGKQSFKLSSLRKGYADYVSKKPQHEEHLNFYRYVSKKFNCVPNFFGYQSIPCWPMDEDFAKWTLFFFIPHDGKSLQPINDSYAKRLEAELTHPQFPPSLLARLLRLKNKYVLKLDEEVTIPTEGGNFSPTTDRENAQNEEVADVADGLLDDKSVDGEAIDFGDVDFPLPDPSIIWNSTFNPDARAYLHDLKKMFYSTRGGSDNDKLGGEFREALYCPENAQGETQMLIIGAFLVHIRDWMRYFDFTEANQNASEEEVEKLLPPCVRCYIQGNPGSGKSFVIHTISNILFNLLRSLKGLLKVAPTGCASALIHGCTTTRGNHVPCGKKLFSAPTFNVNGNTKRLSKMIELMEALYVMIYDEHSMENRSTWAWKQNNCSEFRKDMPSPHPKHLVERSFGGIPIVMSFGDCHQLPPVTGNPHYSRKKGKAQSSDEIGMTVFNNFINSPDTEAEVSYCFMMDSIFRQNDESYHGIIMKMRSGQIGREEADKLVGRELSNLPAEERLQFEQEALYVVPTWKDALPIIKKYMVALDTPIVKVGCTTNTGRVDHISKECPLPKTNAFCAGAAVMLLTNFVVEYNLYNGAVGVIVDIVFENADGPLNVEVEYPEYIIVDFPDSSIPPEHQYDTDNPTFIPVPLVTMRCEKNCCSMTTIPLRVCKAITIHKCQGISIGNGEKWSKIVIVLPGSKCRLNAPGLECVAISRAKEFSDMAFMETDKHEINMARFMKIERSKAYEDRNDFEQN